MDAFDRLAERLVRGAQEEYVRELTERLASMLLRGVDNPDGLALLPRVSREAAMGVWAEHERSVTGSVREAFAEALAQASSEDAAAVARQAGTDEPPALTEWAEERVEQAARATAESVRRQNLALAQTEADEFYATVADASARLNLGEGRYSVIERAIARLAKAGVETVDYLTGRRTTVDAAVRRIVVTQQNRCRNELLQRRCEEFGHDLVLVSAHYGCRPTHEWFQGKVFSRSGGSGETTASGGVRTTYRPLSDTGYPGDPAGLCGANCRHTMTPFVEGYSKLPDTEFESQQKHFGMTSAEYYAATQRQRALERRVRAAKREVAVGQAQGLDMVDSRLRLGRAQAELRAWCAANHLTRDPSRERAYGVAEQPRGLAAPQARKRRDPGGPTRDESTRSRFMGASDFDELATMLEDLTGSGLPAAIREYDFESVRGFVCGIDDALNMVGASLDGTFHLSAEQPSGNAYSEVSSSGKVRMSAKWFGSHFGAAVSTGRHEGAHIVEAIAAGFDNKAFDSGKWAEKVLLSALKAYNRDHKDKRFRNLEEAIGTMSRYPVQESVRKSNRGVFYSEGLAVCFEDQSYREVRSGSFSFYAIEAARKAIAG